MRRAGGDGLAPAWLERAVLAALVALFAWKGWAPAWRQLNTDFPNYYLAANLHRQGYPLDRLYETTWLQRQKDHAGLDQGLVAFVPLTPFSALVVEPLAGLPPLAAKRVWMAFSLALLGGAALLLRRLSGLGWRRVGLCIFLTVVPLRTNFLFGQQSVLILFCATLAAWWYRRGWKVAAGSVLAAAASLKLYPAVLGLMFARKRQWRALGGLAAAGALVGLLGVWLFGWEPLRLYALRILPRAVLRGEVVDPYGVVMSSFTGLLRRLFVFEPALNPRPLLDAPAAFAILQPIVQGLLTLAALGMVAPRDQGGHDEAVDWGRFLAMLLLLSSGSASYHYCLLILSTALVLGVLIEQRRHGEARALLGLHALVAAPYYRFVPQAPEGWAIFLGYPRLYALAAYCLFLARLRRGAEAAQAPQAVRVSAARREMAVVAVALGALAVYGAVAGLRSLRGQMASYPRRVPGAGAAIANAEPAAAAAGGVFFTRMDDEGYVLDRARAPLRVRLPRGTDLLQPALPAGGGDGLVEIAGPTSRIARFDPGAPALDLASLRVEVSDAERPVLSASGRWLAFSRPVRGRGDLWLLERGTDAGAAPQPARKLLSPGFDVLDYTFRPTGGWW